MSFAENILVGSRVIQTTATDGDLDAITYAIIEGNEVSLITLEYSLVLQLSLPFFAVWSLFHRE